MGRRVVNEQTPALERAAIIDAALTLLDRDGINGLSLRKLAGELHVQAPALYWHIKDKTSLLDYMAEAILQAEFEVLEPRKDDELWEEWFIGIMHRLRKSMWAYRDGARVVTGAHLFPATTLIKIFEVSYVSLTSAGITMETAHVIIATTVHFVFGRVIEEQSGPTPEQLAQIDATKAFEAYPLFLRSIQSSTHPSDGFEDSLRLIVLGATANINKA